jgi:hypothetical protein
MKLGLVDIVPKVGNREEPNGVWGSIFAHGGGEATLLWALLRLRAGFVPRRHPGFCDGKGNLKERFLRLAAIYICCR